MLKTDYKNDVLDTSKNTKRKYQQTTNSDGTISLDDVTVYSQEGSLLGANDINATNEVVNTLDSNLTIDGDYKFRVGVDGDGNVGYYKADDSFIPFKKGSTPIYYGYAYSNSWASQPTPSFTAQSDGKLAYYLIGGGSGTTKLNCNGTTIAQSSGAKPQSGVVDVTKGQTFVLTNSTNSGGYGGGGYMSFYSE